MWKERLKRCWRKGKLIILSSGSQKHQKPHESGGGWGWGKLSFWKWYWNYYICIQALFPDCFYQSCFFFSCCFSCEHRRKELSAYLIHYLLDNSSNTEKAGAFGTHLKFVQKDTSFLSEQSHQGESMQINWYHEVSGWNLNYANSMQNSI